MTSTAHQPDSSEKPPASAAPGLNNESASRQLLDSLGISEEEEELYRRLLTVRSMPLSELARSAGFSSKNTARMVAILEERGLVSRIPGRNGEIVAAPPRVAIEALVRRRQQDLERVRIEASGALEDLRRYADVTGTAEMVEVVTGPEAVYQRFLQVLQAAQEEVRVFDRPPYARIDQPGENPEFEVLKRGVRCRALYDRAAVESGLEDIQRCVALGEEARVINHLPMKLISADRRLAIVPLFINDPEGKNLTVHQGLLVHSSALLDALVDNFETLWERGIPLGHPGATDAPAEKTGEITEEERRILAFLAAGMKDEVIARRLDLATRTVQRRVARLMELLGAETRFQAGIQAVRQSWL
jgi:sugar-specific transcriptional regulator TrmB/DNA-binding CsgD family transcriptional regulator